jgi:hypothetical protein
MSTFLTACLSINLCLQVWNAFQYAFEFPLAVNDIYNLILYAYMGLVPLVGNFSENKRNGNFEGL